MNDVLAMCGDLPQMSFAKGDTLIEEGIRTDRLYVLERGAVEVLRNGVRVVLVTEPGSFLGEISAVLGSAPTASVVAARDSTVRVIDGASKVARSRPELTYAIAQLLAQRLRHVIARPQVWHGLLGNDALLPRKLPTTAVMSWIRERATVPDQAFFGPSAAPARSGAQGCAGGNRHHENTSLHSHGDLLSNRNLP